MTHLFQRFTAQWLGLVERFKPQSASVRAVLKLSGSSAGSQVIAVAAAPILTRLYGPESFGVLATFTSILALLNVVSSLRYELAIAVPDDDDEAIALIWLCFGLVAMSTALTTLGVALLGNQLVSWLHQPGLKPLLWLLPAGVLLMGVYQPLSYWAIRRKQFGLLAQSQFRQSLIGLAINLAAAPLGTIGLLLGQIVIQSGGFLAIFLESIGELMSFLLKKDLPQVLFKTLKRYSHFGVYSSPAGIVNMMGDQLPFLVFASAFGSANIGQLAIAQKFVILPVALIGNSVSQVFLSQASSHFRRGSLDEYAKRAGFRLFIVSISLSLFLIFFVSPLAPLILGAQWIEVRQIIPMLTPLLIGRLTVSTLSMAFVVSEKNRLELSAQLGQAIFRIVILFAAVFAGLSFRSSVFAVSIGSLLGYMCYAYLIFASLSHKQQRLF